MGHFPGTVHQLPTRLRLVHCCDWCGRERDVKDLAPSKDIHGKKFCRTDIVACLNKGWKGDAA